MRSLVPRDMFNFFDDLFGFSEIDKPSFSIPLINTKEVEGGMQYEVAAPGLEKADFDVDVEGNRLRISVQKQTEVDEEDEGYSRREYNFSSCSRSVGLPGDADTQNISATYEQGVLKVFVPVEQKPGRVKVNVD